jgi:hypothetical protein
LARRNAGIRNWSELLQFVTPHSCADRASFDAIIRGNIPDPTDECPMNIETCIVTTILLGLAASSLAQEKPNFSGEWILNWEASTLSPGADAMKSGVWQIEHREPTFRHKAAFTSADGASREYQYELQTDGREVVSEHKGGRTVSKMQWDGNALVVTFRTQRADGEMTVSFRYELIDAGRRLRAAEQLRGTDHDQDNVWMFDRR